MPWQQARAAFHRYHGDDPPWECAYCEQPILVRGGCSGDALHVHHVDKNVRNNARENLLPMHGICHRRYHQTGVIPIRSDKWKKNVGKAVAESNQKRSGTNWLGNQYSKRVK